ncbi:cerebellar degeneration-related protein 2-like [Myxocyprinus asiaticus]|uniref:cerebellar degeneration-related protein 2-like n=1 Tax=Myxocyprinus asiaticus TaxID=70543 RepID=UPI002222C66F|nr:cerebellar degeneration-related protein 2-like [Myxocyprinus asiaticus]
MLTDMIEYEFDIKEEEPRYDHQDLEHDLHLAAELGKNVLERNRDLEKGLQQMYATNQEQLQEIEYLSKQVDLLRSVNDQHANVYEQLDNSARDLEQTNQRLVLENRAAHLKIYGLTETVEVLQTHVEELQGNVKELKSVSAEQTRPSAQPCNDQGLTCYKKQCQLQKLCSHEHTFSASCSSLKEEEHLDLLRSVHSLQAQLSTERALREAAEHEADALARELSELEPKLALLGGYQDRIAEMETEVKELRLLLRSSTHTILPDTVFFSSEDEVGMVKRRRCGLKRCCSERQLCNPVCEEGGAIDSVRENGRCCFQQVEEAKHHSISFLKEVDAQYTALQEKYNMLLRHSETGMLPQNHKAVQTPPASSNKMHTHSQSVSTHDDTQLPKYKALFHEIFAFIQKSKKDMKENRIKPSQAG